MLDRFQISKGVATDLPAFAVGPDYFTGGQNIDVRPFAERIPGYAAVYATPQAEVRSLLNASIGGVNYWVYHGKATSYVVAGAVHTNVTHATPPTSHSDSNRITASLFNGLPVFNNALDAPSYWDGNLANKFVTLPGWVATDRAYSLRAWGNFLVAMGMTHAASSAPSEVQWSSAAAAGSMPSSWTAAATNEAGSSPKCADTPGGLIDGAPLGKGFLLYKERSAYVMTYKPGSTFVMNIDSAPGVGRGVLTRNCIAQWGGRHFILAGDGDIGLTDGNTFESVADNRVRALIFNQLDSSNYQRAFVVAYPRRDQIWVCYPTTGSTFCNRAQVWDAAKNTWGPERELPNVSCGAIGIVSDTTPSETWDSDGSTWDSDSTVWDSATYSSARASLLLGAPNDSTPTSSLILEQDRGLTANGATFEAKASKYGMALRDPSLVKLVRRVYLEVDAAPGVQLLVKLGAQQEAGGATTWSTERTYTVGAGKPYVDIFARGKYISLEARSTASAPWKLPAFSLEYDFVGRH